ncbi:MAG: helix-turn-helix transcriptional regulator [Clostridiales bacterium]|nr:helix-turn-helix transcriptional regulator [Clostridiales bacterium]
MKTVKEARLEAGLTQAKMAEIMGIPKRTIEAWEAGDRTPPEYVERLVIAELKRIGEKEPHVVDGKSQANPGDIYEGTKNKLGL